jgi:nucleotide-binding universal stress UspA family protein
VAGYETILVPHDFSEHSEAALRLARDLAARLGSRIHLLHVIRPFVVAYPTWTGGADAVAPEAFAAMERGAEQALRNEAEKTLPRGASFETHVVSGATIAGTIREFAKKIGADLIVMGTHGRTGFAHAFLGSSTERTLRDAPCPVLTVRAAEG